MESNLRDLLCHKKRPLFFRGVQDFAVKVLFAKNAPQPSPGPSRFQADRAACGPKLRLDLANAQQRGGSEAHIQREKLAAHRHILSEICPGVYVSGQEVATCLAQLRENGVTAVLNLAGATCTTRHQGLTYKVLSLNGK